MNARKKKTIDAAAQDLSDGLGGLFGALNDALSEMMTRLEDGTSGTVERDHTFQTPKGPVRAQAGVRVRMGGLGGEEQRTATVPRPVNPDRQSAPPPPKPKREVLCDVFEDDDSWTVMGDMPGVARKEVQVTPLDQGLQISTDGARQYRATVDLGQSVDVDAAQITLRNGILTLKIPKVATE